MMDSTGTLVIGVLIMGLIVMARTCGLRGQRGVRADESAPPPASQRRAPDITNGFRDPAR